MEVTFAFLKRLSHSMLAMRSPKCESLRTPRPKGNLPIGIQRRNREQDIAQHEGETFEMKGRVLFVRHFQTAIWLHHRLSRELFVTDAGRILYDLFFMQSEGLHD
jgi:hypothetical protein